MFLGVDIGSSSIKVMAIDGVKHYKAKAEYPSGTSPYEHAAEVVKGTIAEAIQNLFKETPVKPEDIQALALDGHGPSIIFTDEKGDALTPLVTWQDKRASEESKMLESLIPGYHKDGTAYEAKLVWFAKHHPELFREGVQAYYPNCYIIRCLCGISILDSSTASTLIYYDRKNKSWEPCREFFDPCVMPDVFPSWETVGYTCTEFSRACGLPDGVAIVPGGIDSFCEAIGAGGIREGIVVDGSGTSTCLTFCKPQDGVSAEHVLPGLALECAMQSSTGSSYKWVSSLFPETDMMALQEKIDAKKPVDLIYLPYLVGERSPINDDDATGVFLGLTPNTDQKDMLQAVMQGVAFATAQNLDLMHGEVKKLRGVGGANSSPLWLQIKANSAGIPVEQMEENDAASFGSALLAAYGNGNYTLDEVEKLLGVKRVVEPQDAQKEQYKKLRKAYENLYPAIKGIYQMMK